MVLEKQPFVPYRLEEERANDKSRTLTIRINKEEDLWLTELKDLFDTDQEAAALKLAAKVGLKVLHNTFSADDLKWLFKKDRVRRTP